MISAQEQALRNLKLSNGMTWKALAKALGITERSILSYVAAPGTKGYREMPTEVWHKLENISGHELDRNNAGLYFPKKKVISISSQKGGVGKTSLVAIIASIFANMGYRVLVIDMDPQGNLTEQYYREDQDFPSEILADPDGDEFSPGPAHVWNMFQSNVPVNPLQISDNLYLVGSSLDLADIQLGDPESVISNFNESINKLQEDFDLVILDTLPSFGNALAAAHRSADWLVIPTELARFSKKGITYQLRTAMNTKNVFNTDLTLLGIVVNKITYTSRKDNELLRIQENYRELLEEQYGDLMLSPALKLATSIVESQAIGVPLIEYAPKSETTLQFTQLSQELLRRIKVEEEGIHG
ncbi:ParA family protein [Enterobacter hormaechei]